MNTKKIILSGFFITMSILLPIIFHSVGMIGGQIFLPMHIPVLLAGFLVGPFSGLIVGIISPILSSIFTGMPPMMPILPIMVIELALYGLCTGYIFKKTKNAILSLIISMIIGRIGAGLVVFVLVRLFTVKLPLNSFIYIKGAIVTGVPGIIIQLILIPSIMLILNKRKKEWI